MKPETLKITREHIKLAAQGWRARCTYNNDRRQLTITLKGLTENLIELWGGTDEDIRLPIAEVWCGSQKQITGNRAGLKRLWGDIFVETTATEPCFLHKLNLIVGLAQIENYDRSDVYQDISDYGYTTVVILTV